MTVREAYDAAVRTLKENGFDDQEAHLSARLIIDELTEASYAHLLKPDKPLNDEVLIERWYDFISGLISGEPLAYIRRQREFYGLKFISDNRALIPRPETELLVEHVVDAFKNHERVLVADLGTGSGCIAVSIAHSLSQAVVYATDLSSDAITLARENARLNNVENRVEFVAGQSGEWAQPLLREGFGAMFDCIVTNPPYISPADIEALPTQIKDHEPRMALDGGADGLDCYRQIATQCGTLLSADGFLLAELGAGQFAEARTIFEMNGWQVDEPILDFAGHERVLRATSTQE